MLLSQKAAIVSLVAAPALLCFAPAIASAAPENASGYLATLDQHHVAYSDPGHIIHIGTTLCHELRNNLPSDEALRRIQNLGYTSRQAGVIAADAVLSFCPDMNADIR